MQNDREWWVKYCHDGDTLGWLDIKRAELLLLLNEHRKRVVREIREACCDVCKDALDLKNEKNV